jgi:hypothetical protein
MVITGNALVKRHKKLQEERFQLQKELASTSSMVGQTRTSEQRVGSETRL